MLANAAISALANLLVLAGIPFLFYFLYQKWRYKRAFAEVAQRAGLRLGKGRYIGYSLVFALAGIAVLVTWPPPWNLSSELGRHNKRFAALASVAPPLLRRCCTE